MFQGLRIYKRLRKILKNSKYLGSRPGTAVGCRGTVILQRQVVRSRDQIFGSFEQNFKTVIYSGAENDEESESITDFEKY